MKYRLFIVVLLVCTFSAKSQDYKLPAMQGLQDKKGAIALEVSGYEIYISEMKGKVNNRKTINSIKKKYGLQAAIAEFSETSFGIENKVIESEQAVNDSIISMNRICCILRKSENKVTVILFQTLNQRDVILEKQIVEMFLKNELSAYISSDHVANTVIFAGDTIHLGNACYWKSPHNLYHKGGQVSWSEFTSDESALLDINNRIRMNSLKATILHEEEIDVLFWGIPATAYRVAYMSKYDYNPLIVYYIVQMVNGHYISCILSNYGYNRNDYELTPLLRQFMDIPVLPETAYKPFDRPEFEENPNGNPQQLYLPEIEVRLGAALPIGQLRNNFSVAPGFGIYIGFPVNNSTTVGMGFQAGAPVNPQPFDYYYKGDIFDAKATAIYNLDIYLKQRKTISRLIRLEPYIAFGMAGINTNKKKPEQNEDGTDVYYSIQTISLRGGCGLRYKKFGVFLEYQYAPYSIAGKVRENFGSSLLNTGLSVCF